MDKLKKSQVLKLFLIAALLIVTPLLSPSLKSAYLYFIVNVLIIVVASEAGLLSFFLKSPDQNRRRANSAVKPAVIISEFSQSDKVTNISQEYKVVDKKQNNINVGEQKVRKSPSTPSIFFIEEEAEEGINNDEGSQAMGEVSGQELFHKAENFIGNFYKQLKMQREESWKKLHDLYQKSF